MDRAQQQQPQAPQMEMPYQQPPPPGYPTENAPVGENKWLPQSKARGEKGFIEGCLAALCCCWICETCCI